MGTAVSGQWILRLRDTTAKELSTGFEKAANRHTHGDGGVAGWEVSAKDEEKSLGVMELCVRRTVRQTVNVGLIAIVLKLPAISFAGLTGWVRISKVTPITSIQFS